MKYFSSSVYNLPLTPKGGQRLVLIFIIIPLCVQNFIMVMGF